MRWFNMLCSGKRHLAYEGPERRLHQQPWPQEMERRQIPRRKGAVRFNWVMFSMSMLIIVLAIAVGVLAVTKTPDQTYAPFEYEPLWRIEQVQEDGTLVIPQVPGYDSPSVYTNERVSVRGIRCNNDGNVPAVANVWWERVDGRNTGIIEIASDLKVVIESGCEPISIDLAVPDDLALTVLDDPTGAQRWKIVGTSRPDRVDGVQASWESEPIWIVAPGQRVNPHTEDG